MKDTINISGLRFQKYSDKNEVHIHDDNNNRKLVAPLESFKKDIKSTLKLLDKKDGVAGIYGSTNDVLYLIKDKEYLRAFIGSGDDTDKINTFVKSL